MSQKFLKSTIMKIMNNTEQKTLMQIKLFIKKTVLTTILYLTLIFAYSQQSTDTLRIFFDIDKSTIEGHNAKLLNKLILNKDIVFISIYGYTDFLGNMAYNQHLSEKRSANVFNYLLNKGIDRENIFFCKGEGVHPNSTEENRQDLSDKGIQAHRMVLIIYTVFFLNILTIYETS